MKRIIMKVLSECYYFKKLEEESPIQFTSLKEKLKYFHPGFHSMTPEGLNSRLTFLLQCLRPGDTIPIKDNTSLDSVSRNTTFGPPPICVMRIGDFYHSKVVIKDINITYDDATWDFNPEGIGVQPMLANVTLQVSFIGGHGLEAPVSRLQNALSSNFYANTEMYDERSETTTKTIDGKDYQKFEKEFLESLQKQPEYKLINDLLEGKEFNFNSYIGTKTEDKIDYKDLVDSFYSTAEQYAMMYKTVYYQILDTFGKSLTGLFLSSLYRTIDKLDVVTDLNTSDEQITLIGEFDPLITDLSTLINNFSTSIKEVIDTVNISVDILKVMDPVLDEANLPQTEAEMKYLFKKYVNEKVDNMISFESLKQLIKKRNELINIVDNLNFLVYFGKDATISGTTEAPVYFDVTLTNFASSDLYNVYSEVITYLNDVNEAIKVHIDDTLDFENESTLTNTMLPTDICGPILLSLSKNDVENTFNYIVDTNGGVDGINPELYQFFKKTLDEVYYSLNSVYESTIIDMPKSPYVIPEVDISYLDFTIDSIDEVFDNTEGEFINKIYSKKLPLTDKLNFYKP